MLTMSDASEGKAVRRALPRLRVGAGKVVVVVAAAAAAVGACVLCAQVCRCGLMHQQKKTFEKPQPSPGSSRPGVGRLPALSRAAHITSPSMLRRSRRCARVEKSHQVVYL
jgi:hypothetical protein